MSSFGGSEPAGQPKVGNVEVRKHWLAGARKLVARGRGCTCPCPLFSALGRYAPPTITPLLMARISVMVKHMIHSYLTGIWLAADGEPVSAEAYCNNTQLQS
jgi:hypothetical protein